MNVNQLLDELTWRLGNRSDVQARTLTWLNDAYFELLMSPRFTYFTLDRTSYWQITKGVRVYQVSTVLPNYWFIIDLRNETDQIKLKKHDATELDRVYRTTGSPNRYARFADQIELDPTPDDNYIIIARWRMRPPELVNGGVHMLTREWDEVITTMAVQKGWEALEQWDKATAQKQVVEVQLQRRQDVADMEAVDDEITIGVAYGRT